MIRVDHAGEHGAVRIYDGQLAVFAHVPGMEKQPISSVKWHSMSKPILTILTNS